MLGAILAQVTDLTPCSDLHLPHLFFHPPLPIPFDLKRPVEEIKEGDEVAATEALVAGWLLLALDLEGEADGRDGPPPNACCAALVWKRIPSTP